MNMIQAFDWKPTSPVNMARARGNIMFGTFCLIENGVSEE